MVSSVPPAMEAALASRTLRCKLKSAICNLRWDRPLGHRKEIPLFCAKPGWKKLGNRSRSSDQAPGPARPEAVPLFRPDAGISALTAAFTSMGPCAAGARPGFSGDLSGPPRKPETRARRSDSNHSPVKRKKLCLTETGAFQPHIAQSPFIQADVKPRRSGRGEDSTFSCEGAQGNPLREFVVRCMKSVSCRFYPRITPRS